MYLLIIITIIWIGITVFMFWGSNDFSVSFDGVLFWFFGLGVCCALFGSCNSAIISQANQKVSTRTYVNTYEILSLNDNNQAAGSMSGAFFVGIGGISGSYGTEMHYQFYYSKGTSEVFYKKLKTEEAHLYQEGTRAYYSRTIKETIVDCRDVERWILSKPYGVERKVIREEIHVPSGTIKRNYVMDLN